MSDMGKIVAIIPARGGSKGIPKKNIVPFRGKPLLAWSILHARRAKLVDGVFVSTDNEEIAKVALRYGAKVIKRPAEISGDTATSESALEHAVTSIREHEGLEIAYVVFLQATSPVREPIDIDNAIRKIKTERADSLFSGAELRDFGIWARKNGKLTSVNYDYRTPLRRQEVPEQYVANGSIYVFKPKTLFRFHNRLGGKIALSEMELWKSFEIDELEDLEFCETICKVKGINIR